MNHRGIIVGCDKNQEWLLSWWWKNYSLYNDYPVAFADFGMSEQALSWCKEKGTILSIPSMNGLKENSAFHTNAFLNQNQKEILERYRTAWFKKPLALLQSPFSIGIWIDLDCQIKGFLGPIFDALDVKEEIGLVRDIDAFIYPYIDPIFYNPDQVKKIPGYNSGVILFRKNAVFLQKWLDEIVSTPTQYLGDQDPLSYVSHQYQTGFIELPAKYNGLRILGPNPNALIYHFTGGEGKLEIFKQIHPEQELLIDTLKGWAFYAGQD